MKITKKIEKEILEVMEDYWGSYLSGDFDSWASYLPDNYGNIGTTKEEIWKSKKEIMDYTDRISEQVTGTAEIRNKVTQFIPYDPYIMVHEVGDMFLNAEEGWIFYAQVRLSSLLEKTEKGWKVLHQHGSYPDSKAETGEAYGFDELKIENKKLKDAIQRRTLELERNNRNLEIEAALEKVRSRSLTVTRTEEFNEVVAVVFEKLGELRIPVSSVTIATNPDHSKDRIVYGCGEGEAGLATLKFHLPYFPNAFMDDIILEQCRTLTGYFSKVYSEEDKRNYYDHVFEYTELKHLPEDIKQQVRNSKSYGLSTAYARNSSIMVNDFDGNILSDDQADILKRFSRVFEQAFIRFLDLQKAEAQAREAKIEAALEKVRSRSMGMQKSAELEEVIQVVYEQFTRLDIFIEHTGFIIDYKNRDDMHIWLADMHGAPSELVLPYFDSPHWNSFRDAKEKGLDLFTNLLNNQEKNKFYKDLFKLIPDIPKEVLEHYLNVPALAISTVLLDNIGLYIENFSGVPYTEEENKILLRFGKVFQQTYTRFLDLKKAEAQARESQIETALERVRASIMAMHRTEDLHEAALLLFQQVEALGVPLMGCGFNIWDDDRKAATAWMTGLDRFQPPFKTSSTEDVFQRIYEAAQKGDSLFVEEQAGEVLKEHYKYMASIPVFNKILVELAKKGLSVPSYQIVHCAYFSQGYLMFISLEPVSYAYDIFERFAKVFEQAYIRFLDLQTAEYQADLIKEEKERLEITLKELKETQGQLIHAEKMASLGELTAGIAHEIQNPLNFVNNFSEVSSELIEEAKEEMEAGEYEEAIEIMNDLMQNLQKIHHHGERASSIVNGMLEHSRTDSGEKVKADINQLADECLRLSYHGMKAKDRDFRGEFDIQLDPDLPKLKIVSQDIGRVLLNLINNAFQACNEVASADRSGKVTLSTKNLENKIQISVIDNGPGIQEKIRDKIFQPFFTTKPTGQGTGLGLSLSYDIIKAHGGEITVSTEIGKGSNFLITLPKPNIV